MKNKMFTAMLAVFLAGCTTETPESQNEVVTRIGNLPEDVMQHPSVAESLSGEKQDQFYFDVDDRKNPVRQIIVVYPDGMAIPTESGRKIKLKGIVSTFAVGGVPGTRGEYENKVLDLRNWEYLE